MSSDAPRRPFGVVATALRSAMRAPSGVPARRPTPEGDLVLRLMEAVRKHAERHGSDTPLVSPWHALLRPGAPAGGYPPGFEAVSRYSCDLPALRNTGFPVVTFTVNDPQRIRQLLDAGVQGIISDRPDVLYATIAAWSRETGTPGLLPDGRVNLAFVDAQGHRGARGLRPENTLPAMEAALDHLMTTLETDTAITACGVPLVTHDPQVSASKVRRLDRRPYGERDEVLVKDLTVDELQSRFVGDVPMNASGAVQRNDPALSPVAVAYADHAGLPHPYSMPTLAQLFDFVAYYAHYYRVGPGRHHPQAEARAANADGVRFNIDTKIDPWGAPAHSTVGPVRFADAVADVIVEAEVADRAIIQSFDWRSLFRIHRVYPQIRTSALFPRLPLAPGQDDELLLTARRRPLLWAMRTAARRASDPTAVTRALPHPAPHWNPLDPYEPGHAPAQPSSPAALRGAVPPGGADTAARRVFVALPPVGADEPRVPVVLSEPEREPSARY